MTLEWVNKVMIVAGEASGDGHAAKLAHALVEIAPQSRFFGCAGPKMRATGVEAIVKADDLSIVGLPEIAAALPKFLSVYRQLVKAAEERKPEVVILVDFPEFNLKLARTLKKRGFKIVYYISPQLWAWRKYRIRTIKSHVDLLISILPFEKRWYADHGVDKVEYVGSPLAREVHANLSKEEFCRKHGLDPARPIVSLLPGSRHKEIVQILPELLRTAALMSVPHAVAGGLTQPRDNPHLQPPATASGTNRPKIQFVVAFASDRHGEVEDALSLLAGADRFGIGNILSVFGETYDALSASDAAAVTSGTATLETGIIGTPMAIVYKTSGFNYKLMRPLIDVEHFGLINLIAGERVAKELIQDDFTAETLSAELFRLLGPDENAAVRARLHVAADKLGHGGASKRAAEAIVKLLAR
jgi:lipid-A-disaccharide synthase